MGEKLECMFERLDSRFDVLAQVLEAAHLGRALSARIELGAPWALHFADTNRRAGFHVVTAGRCCVLLDGTTDAVELGAGDIVVFPHGAGHVLADQPDTPSIEIHEAVGNLAPGQRMSLPNAGSGAPASVLCGSYSFAPDGTNPLLRGLPQLLHLSAEKLRNTPLEAAMQWLAAEANGAAPGTALIIDRLVDLLFIYALRLWTAQQDASSPQTWFGALQDPVVGPAVHAVHGDPAYAWTVENLAQRAGLSRAAFARRFQQAMGEPPLSYVTRWRMTVAAGLLADGHAIAHVADRVGYENEFAFAKAFKRIRGLAPGQHRQRHAKQRTERTTQAESGFVE
ncbi:AraC-type DNA-binding protein [Dyella sp. OK004]|nr:AraC-type DNA-binding protein [Dyella sp. OK004]